MKKRAMVAAAGVMLLGAVCGAAQTNPQDRGYWRAATNTTEKMTAEIAIAETKVTLNTTTFPVVPVRKLKPAEVTALFDADVNAGISGNLYGLHVRGGTRIVEHSTLCGDEETRWMVTYVTGRTLQVAFFSGDDPPEFTFDAISNSTTLCARYTYTRE